MSTELAKAVCPRGHTWDAWGTWDEPYGAPESFVPADLQTYICPTCDGVAETFGHVEHLS